MFNSTVGPESIGAWFGPVACVSGASDGVVLPFAQLFSKSASNRERWTESRLRPVVDRCLPGMPSGYKKSRSPSRVDSKVAGKFDFCRRRQNLSFSHHQEVAALDEDTADDKRCDQFCQRFPNLELDDPEGANPGSDFFITSRW